MIVAGVVGARVGGIAWPALVAAGNLLAIVGVVVFFAAGFLYTIQFIRGLLTDWGSNE